ncbi:hypothetical protein [Tenacibaculum aiptasiae]|uniref:hypothetical protein n=1 Tax=Tenacibaculum aiptasiae TaxID=426481 RepID=UPI003B5B69C7
MELNWISKLNKREKQAIGALAVKLFCDKYFIEDHKITELLNHLLLLLKSSNLMEWEEKGFEIAITGRGDELPNDLINKIPKELFKDFYKLIDRVIEIGIVDLYGDDTEFPDKFLISSINILKSHNILLKIPNEILSNRGLESTTSWGRPLEENRYKLYRDLIM